MARKVLVNNVENGGIKMLDFRSFCISIKAAWAWKLYNCNKETWEIIPRKYFEKCDIATLLCMNSDKEKYKPI